MAQQMLRTVSPLLSGPADVLPACTGFGSCPIGVIFACGGKDVVLIEPVPVCADRQIQDGDLVLLDMGTEVRAAGCSNLWCNFGCEFC